MSEQVNTQLYKPGQSGNPLGKPRGTKNKTTLMKQALEHGLVEHLEKDIPAIYKKAVSMALNGNETMLKFFLERIIPKATLDLSEVNKAGGTIVINVGGMSPPNGQETTINGEVINESSSNSSP